MPNIYKLAALVACLSALGGCVSLNPHYQRPASPIEQSFQNSGLESSAATINAVDWKKIFIDPRLQNVISLALQNNRDLRVAMLNIDKARATYRIQRADLFPSIDASASRTSTRSGTTSSTSQVSRSTSASVGFTSWELDLFGRIQSLNQEALETYFATEETQRSSRMSLIAETAGDWLTVAAYQQQLHIAQQTLQSQEKTLELTNAKYKAGVASALDYEEIKTSVDSARADIASYKKLLAQAKNALDLVVGTTVPSELLPQQTLDIDSIQLASIPNNLSSDVLLNHPDVLYAEHTLKAANADIGAARAAFFPTISLTATAGRSSSALDNLFSAGAQTWSFIPSISMPIFQAGSLKASLDSTKIQKNIYVAQYEKAIQSAFTDVKNAFATREYIQEQLSAQQDLIRSSERSYKLSNALYKEGQSSYLNVLTAQRTYYTAQQSLVTLLLEEQTNRVTLYKVLGGGADAQ